jgi:hypothetical protein
MFSKKEKKQMKRNQKCIVSEQNPRFPNRIRYFQFFGKGPSEGCAVLTNKPTLPWNDSGEYFVVNNNDILPVCDNHNIGQDFQGRCSECGVKDE